ncbi:hypothetical protein KY338_07050 [Candidatus Woesearchaeota archaeon]|nr:hypothetical protein [Candidatus Woesearchaeota archaeon]MBW3005383.1 hypothetical protein [Candidatus Woesearchaeota archaeon]
MDERKLALWVLGIIVVIAIIGLVLLFKAQKTGDAIASDIVYSQNAVTYSNKAGDPFPYTRKINKIQENPAAYGVQADKNIPDFGGAGRAFGGTANPGPEIAVSKGFVYPREPDKKIHQVLTSCTGQANIGAIPQEYTRPASVQLAQSLGLNNCVQAPEQISNFAYCCKEPGMLSRYG